MFFFRSKVLNPEKPRVLMYHMVRSHRAKARFNKMRVHPEAFEEQMSWLKSDGWTVLSVSDFFSQWGRWPLKSAVLTFDDGYEDNFLNAYPVLRAHALPFTIFLVNDRHDNDWSSNKKSHHNSGELMEEPKLSDKQVKTMLDSGLLELGGHTIGHVNLLNESGESAEREIAGCRDDLAATFSVPVASFCYPFGLYNQEAVETVQRAGYIGAFTVEESLASVDDDPFQVGRLKVSGKMSLRSFKRMMNRGSR